MKIDKRALMVNFMKLDARAESKHCSDSFLVGTSDIGLWELKGYASWSCVIMTDGLLLHSIEVSMSSVISARECAYGMIGPGVLST